MKTKLSKSAINCNIKRSKSLKRVHFILENERFNTNLNVFSYSLSSVLDTKSTNIPVSLEQVYSIIKDEPKHTHNKIEKYTRESLLASDGTAKENYKKSARSHKLKLPFFLFSGYQPQGHNKEQIEYNGSIQIDIDIKESNGKDKALKYKQKLSKLPFISLCCISPSSYGIKAIVHTTNLDKEKHSFYASMSARLISELCNIPYKYFDILCYSQACFVPSDKDIHINRQARALTIEVEQEQELESDYTIQVENEQEQKKKEPKEIKPKQAKAHNNKPLERALIERACKKALELAKEKHEHRTTIASAYSGCTLAFGVEYEQALDYLSKEPNFEQKHFDTVREIYSRYFESFGSNRFKIFDTIELPEPKYKLKKNQKLASTEIAKEFESGKNLLVVSPTGTGKTYLIAKSINFPRVLVVLTQALVREVADSYGAIPFYSEESQVSTKDTFICTTYKSFERLTNKIDTKKYTVFVDESHNTTSARYIAKDLTKVLENLCLFKNYHLLTATPLLNSHPTIKELETVRASEIEPQKRVFRFSYYKDSLFLGVLERAIHNKEQNIQSAILFNNTQSDVGRLHDLLELLDRYKFKYAVINSTTKDTQEFESVVINGDMSELDIIISTSILKEGNSITKHAERVECLTIGSFHASTIEQFSARFRRAKTKEVVIFKNIKSEFESALFLFKAFIKEEREQQERLREHAQSALDDRALSTENKEIIAKAYLKHKNACLDVCIKSQLAQINELKLSMYAHELEKSSMNKDSFFMSAYLNIQYGWIEQESLYFYGKESALKKAENKKAREKNKAIRRELWLSILEQIKDTSDISQIQASTLKEKKIVREIREKLEFLEKFYETREKALEVLAPKDREPLDTKTKFQKLKNQLLVTVAKNKIEIYGARNECALWIKEIDTELKDIERFSSAHAREIVNKANRKAQLKEVTAKRALDIIKCFCEIKRRNTKDENRKNVNYYEIIDHNPTKLEIKIPFDYKESKRSQNSLSDAEWKELQEFYGL